MKRHFFALAVLLCGACGTPDKHTESPFAPAPDPKAGPPEDVVRAKKPWTERFFSAGALVARDVRVEGPDGLLDHVVATQDLAIMDVETKTTTDGLLQVYTLHADAVGETIRAQLDNLTISSLHSLTILERPGPVDVLIVATGDAYLNEKGAAEQRAPTLRISGKIAR